jgi:TatD DNase family protein
MHTHLDMVVHFVQDVQAEIDEKISEIARENEVLVANGTRSENLRKLPDRVVVPTVGDLVRDAVDVGIRGFLHCGCEMDDILQVSDVLDEMQASHEQCPSLNEVNGNVNSLAAGAIAIHPNEAALHAAAHSSTVVLEETPDGLGVPEILERHRNYTIDECLTQIERIAKSDNRIKVIGETGLDYFRTAGDTAIKAQQESFREHIRLAQCLGLSIQVHDRESHADIVRILKEENATSKNSNWAGNVLFHSFSGDVDLAQECIENGWYTSFSGPITFRPNVELREAFIHMHTHRPELLLTETDAPFLTPAPFRGRPNSPAQIPHTIRFEAAMLAEHSGKALEQQVIELCELYSRNATTVISTQA